MAFDANIILRGQAMQQSQQDNLFNRLNSMAQNKRDNQYRDEMLKLKKQQVSKQDFDFEKMAQQALLRKVSGQSTEQDDMLLQAYSAFEGPKTSLQADPYGDVKAVTQPALWDRLQSIGRTPGINPGAEYGRPNGPQNIGAQGQGTNPAPSMNYEDIKPALGSQLAEMAFAQENAPPDMLNLPMNEVVNTPYQQKGTFDANTEVSTELAKTKGKMDLEKQANEAEIQKRRAQNQKLLDAMREEYLNLDKQGGAIKTIDPNNSTTQQVLKNIQNSIAASESIDPLGILPGGQDIGRAIGLETAATRDRITNRIPSLFGQLRADIGLTGKELDTPREREFYLRSLSSPKGDLQTQLELIKELESVYGLPKEQTEQPRFPAALEGKKVRNKQTGEVGTVVNGQWVKDE